jgi:20S proteasome alpha/beta subunit
MTVIVSAHGTDFLVIGADSRGTARGGGARVEVNNVRKVLYVGTHAAVLMCGEGGPAANLVDLLVDKVGSAKLNTRELATILAKIGQNEALSLRDVPTRPGYFSDVGYIVAGLDQPGSKSPRPRSFAIDSGTGYRLELATGGFLIDGKSLIPRYLFSRHYSDDLTLDELEGLVVGALHEAMSVDGDVGGRMRIGVITRSGAREAPSEEVETVLKRWIADHPHRKR